MLFIVGIALSLQVKMLLFPLSGTQQARSSSFPPWPREVCDFIYLATSGCILIKVNLKRWTTYHSISSTRNPTVHSISSTPNPTRTNSLAFPRLGLAYFYRKGFAKDRLFFDLDKHSIEGNFQGTEREGGSIFNFPCFQAKSSWL